MKLDRFQIAEFNDHWANSYVDTPKGLGYVRGVLEGQVISVTVYTPGGKGANINMDMEEVEPVKIAAGFYNFHQQVMLFQRVAHQGRTRGLSGQNSSFGICTADANSPDLRCELADISSDKVVAAYGQNKKPTSFTKEGFFNDLEIISKGTARNFILGRNYSIISRVDRAKMKLIPAVMGLGGLIGKFDDNGELVLDKKVDYFADSIFEEIQKAGNFEVKINVR